MNKKYFVVGAIGLFIVLNLFFVLGYEVDQYRRNGGYSFGYEDDEDFDGLSFSSSWSGTESTNFVKHHDLGWVGFGIVTESGSQSEECSNGNMHTLSAEFTISTTCTLGVCTGTNSWSYSGVNCSGGDYGDSDSTSYPLSGPGDSDSSDFIHYSMSMDFRGPCIPTFSKTPTSNCANHYLDEVVVNDNWDGGFCSQYEYIDYKFGFCETQPYYSSSTNDHSCNFDPVDYESCNDPFSCLVREDDGRRNIDTGGDGSKDSCCGEVGDDAKYVAYVGVLEPSPIFPLLPEFDTCELELGPSAPIQTCEKCITDSDCNAPFFRTGWGCCSGICYKTTAAGGIQVCCGKTGGSTSFFRDCRSLYFVGSSPCDACFQPDNPVTGLCVDKAVGAEDFISGFDSSCSSLGLPQWNGNVLYKDVYNLPEFLGGSSDELSIFESMEIKWTSLSAGTAGSWISLFDGTTKLCADVGSGHLGGSIHTTEPGFITPYAGMGIMEFVDSYTLPGDIVFDGMDTINVDVWGTIYTYLIPTFRQTYNTHEEIMNLPYLQLGASVNFDTNTQGYVEVSGLPASCSKYLGGGGISGGEFEAGIGTTFSCFDGVTGTIRASYTDSFGDRHDDEVFMFQIQLNY